MYKLRSVPKMRPATVARGLARLLAHDREFGAPVVTELVWSPFAGHRLSRSDRRRASDHAQATLDIARVQTSTAEHSGREAPRPSKGTSAAGLLSTGLPCVMADYSRPRSGAALLVCQPGAAHAVSRASDEPPRAPPQSGFTAAAAAATAGHGAWEILSHAAATI